jgi:hypothetical protein
MTSWWRSRALVLVAALVALVALIALASRGHAPGGGSGTRSVDGDLVFQYLVLLVLLVALAGVPVLVWTIWGTRREVTSLPTRSNWMPRLLVTMVLVVLVIVAVALYRSRRDGDGDGPAAPAEIGAVTPQRENEQAADEFRFDWVPVVVVAVVGLGGATLAVFLLSRAGRHRRRADPADAAAALSDALDESLDDLRAEHDPRRAVIAAYARMERVLAVSGFPRRPAEAPLEFLTRVLRDFLHTSAASVARLTALFERAKFSRHEIGPAMKEEAIDALVAVRDELRAFSA